MIDNFLKLSKKKDGLRRYWLPLNQLLNWLQIQIKIVCIKAKTLFTAIPEVYNGKVYLHLGCGNINKENFINIDGSPYSHVHYVQSLDKLSNFDDDSVDLIYACHCLEHFRYSQTGSVLREWYRVLKNGGVLRLSVPDFDKLVGIYKAHNNDPNVILPQLMGGQNNKYNYHLTSFNIVNLTRYLEDVGFSCIKEWLPGSEELTTFNDLSVYKKEIEGKLYEISLNIEAIK